MELKLSIVTPSLNQGEYIETTIQSVLSQSVRPVEYAVFDGGSTDHTLDILKQYEGELVWRSEKDKGQAHAVNKGIGATSGDIIGWINSDDIYYPDAFKVILENFDKHPEIDVIYGKADHIDQDGRIIESYPTETWDYERLKETCYLCQPAVFFRRRVVDRFGLLDESLAYCMDYEYWLRAGQGAEFLYLPCRLAGSRLYESNKTIGSRVAVHEEIGRMQFEKFGRVPAKWIFSYASASLDARGYDRSVFWQNFKYAVIFLMVSVKKFLEWKGTFSLPVLREFATKTGNPLSKSF